MASIKDLKSSIDSVKSTKRITAAMKMVAAAKLNRATATVAQSRPYATAMESMLTNLAKGSSSTNPLIVGTGKSQNHLFVVVASDRGLCGGFNGNLCRKVLVDVKALEAEGKNIQVVLVGRKSLALLKGTLGDKIVHAFEDLNKPSPEYGHAETVANMVLGMFQDGAFDVCSIYKNVFVNALTQTPRASQLIPLTVDSIHADDESHDTPVDVLYEYEPTEDTILDALLPKNIGVQIFSAMLESFAGEQAARMTAMDNATNNASELIDSLRIEYNRTRQAQITNELIEIISGAEAL